MNIQELDILNALLTAPYVSQRQLAETSGHSLGMVNRCLKNLAAEGFITEDMHPSEAAHVLARSTSPRNAVILAAGFGMRMVPINTETPKGLLEVEGEPLIERLIRQLQEVGIRDIAVVVGFMKEHYEYLMDDFGVDLVVNADYAGKNNLHSLALAASRLGNTYVVPCDIWCPENPFRSRELYPWYMVTDKIQESTSVRVSRKQELVSVHGQSGNRMVGVACLTEEVSARLRRRLLDMDRDRLHAGAFWEDALYEKNRMIVPARVVHDGAAVEINTYEQLRELDRHSEQLRSDAIATIADALHVPFSEITNITVLKKGMTNRSFRFTCGGKDYIMRIPGEGTDQLINRIQEAAVYAAIGDKNLCDNVACIVPEKGFKITEYLDNARVCDPLDEKDVSRCMEKLRSFHRMGLKVDHTFDLFGQIEFYESLWAGKPSVYKDYQTTKQRVFSLKAYIDAHALPYVLTHIDAVPDNFLFVANPDGSEDIRLIDWEYAGMQDPHVDLAMFCIYAMYDRNHVEALIDSYFMGTCPEATRAKIYCYIAVCGLLWSNWCEYKRHLGVEFGEYSLRQYRFAKDYCKIALDAMGGTLKCTE